MNPPKTSGNHHLRLTVECIKNRELEVAVIFEQEIPSDVFPSIGFNEI